MNYDSARKSDEDYRRENLNTKRRFKSAAVNRSVPTTGEEQEEDKDIRLPFILFTGPNDLYHHRLPQVDYRHEIGIGEASRLRTLDIRYLTRGKNVGLSRRHNLPGEIGWSAVYFNNSYASRSRGSSASSILSRPNSFYLPR